MGTTVFTGPLIAGNVLQSDGTGNLAGVGGYTGTANVGFVNMAQTSNVAGNTTTALTQAGTTSGTATGITIPAGSIITDIYVYVVAAFSASATLGIGTTAANANELVSTIPNASLGVGQLAVYPQTGAGGATQVNNWLNVGTTDVNVYVKSSATGTGAFFVTIAYMQGANNYVAGSYT
jgi:hypothetical protein